jgi:hypothetical protein
MAVKGKRQTSLIGVVRRPDWASIVLACLRRGIGKRLLAGHAAAGQGWGRGRGQENPRIHFSAGLELVDYRAPDQAQRGDLSISL